MADFFDWGMTHFEILTALHLFWDWRMLNVHRVSSWASACWLLRRLCLAQRINGGCVTRRAVQHSGSFHSTHTLTDWGFRKEHTDEEEQVVVRHFTFGSVLHFGEWPEWDWQIGVFVFIPVCAWMKFSQVLLFIFFYGVLLDYIYDLHITSKKSEIEWKGYFRGVNIYNLECLKQNAPLKIFLLDCVNLWCASET